MKAIAILLFCSFISFSTNTTDMIDSLKTLIKNKDTEKAITFIKEHPEVLSQTDDNGSSGLMLLAYSELKEVFESAIQLKESYTFHEAIVCGQKETVKDYLDKNPSTLVNTYSSDGFTPLSLAAFFNQTEIAKLLLKLGADPNISAINPSKVNALHSAVAKENYDLCQLIIKKGVDVNATQMQNVTALHSAVHRGNFKLVKLLVENDANISIKMDNGSTALEIAKKEGHKKIEEYLSIIKQ
ncbi:ankyrin repeat domain-containing protein [Aquimarina aggregata]|uniref:ankyrin repeat domain-containing protein n=1 Tax=Aquimarina aggregata TaxID=1642818 RepID=UPI00248FF300|nr:ankyrin repeat domain-containing protein [Aquimarina aggregata]